jgi:hypothetical protein
VPDRNKTAQRQMVERNQYSARGRLAAPTVEKRVYSAHTLLKSG